jgi:RimJ/RimL family protein N-acetyltransferase
MRAKANCNMSATKRWISPVDLWTVAGPKLAFSKAGEHLWGSREFFGLRNDLSALPLPGPAPLCLNRSLHDARKFDGFSADLKRTRGKDYLETVLRVSMCDAGLETLYVWTGPDGSAAYAQWVFTDRNQHLLHAHQPNRYPNLKPGEVLLEGAYTFAPYRGQGVMKQAVLELLYLLREQGTQSVLVYVASGNYPSLRASARLGYTLDHIRCNTSRLWNFSSRILSPAGANLREWHDAVGGKPSTAPPVADRTLRASAKSQGVDR